MKIRVLLLLAAPLCALTLPVHGGDWAQWRGPDRTDVSTETGLLKAWPPSGPTLLWTYENAGVGFSGPAIVGDRLYTMGGRNEIDYVYALDIKGEPKEAWATEIGPAFSNDRGSGGRGTPTVDGDLLYALGGQGELICVECNTGKKLWHTNLRTDLGGKIMPRDNFNWGYSESPLVDGDKVICSPGGPDGTMAAWDKKSGKLLWRSTEVTDPAAYSSTIVAEAGGVRQYVQSTANGVIGIAAKDGKLLWRQEIPVFRTAVIPTPIFADNCVYVSAGYGAGCQLIRLIPEGSGIKAEKIYANRNMVNHHGGVIRVGDHLYGYSDGRGWVCQNFKTGAVAWEEKSSKNGKGSVTCADGHLYCYSEREGTIVLAAATPDGWKESGRFKIPRETTVPRQKGLIWTHPVVANGRLYLRDQDLIFCYDIKEHASP